MLWVSSVVVLQLKEKTFFLKTENSYNAYLYFGYIFLHTKHAR